jgi:phosphatidylserine/phosphatidylglycerophosphate/cardiolipin synthase-like enzyme
LIDPLSDDPLVCSGSANFSAGSLLQNDENMLLVRGNTRIADIYVTEFDRIFRHFYFRDIANELAAANTSDDAKAIFLDETDGWTESYFKQGTLKNNRRIMFFEQPTSTWFENAGLGDRRTSPKPSEKTAKKRKAAKKKKKAAKKQAAKKKTVKQKTAKKKSVTKKTTGKTSKKRSTGKKAARKSRR